MTPPITIDEMECPKHNPGLYGVPAGRWECEYNRIISQLSNPPVGERYCGDKPCIVKVIITEDNSSPTEVYS